MVNNRKDSRKINCREQITRSSVKEISLLRLHKKLRDHKFLLDFRAPWRTETTKAHYTHYQQKTREEPGIYFQEFIDISEVGNFSSAGKRQR